MYQQEGAVVSLNEAARMVGKGESTVRLWLKNGVVRGRKDTNGCWIVERNSLISYVAVEAEKKPQRRIAGAIAHSTSSAMATATGDTSAELVATLRDALTRERALVDEFRRRIEALEARNVELERERGQHISEMRAILTKDTEGKVSRWFRR